MWSLTGICDWTCPVADMEVRETGFTNHRFTVSILRPEGSRDDTGPVSIVHDAGTHIVLLGYLLNRRELENRYGLTDRSEAELFGALFHRFGPSSIHEADGLYLVCIYSESDLRCRVLPCRHGSARPVYCQATPGGFTFSTSLRALLNAVPGKRRLDLRAARDFLHHYYLIPNAATLIEGVGKLVSDQYLEIDLREGIRTIRPLPAPAGRGRKRVPGAGDHLLPSIGTAVTQLAERIDLPSTALAFTAGWDSNLLLHFVRRCCQGTLTAVTIRGGRRKNEVPEAGTIIRENYPDMTHLSGTVPIDALSALPEIVRLYEGYLFQEGMFLRYELARLLAAMGYREAVLAAGADEILWAEMRTAQWRRWLGRIRKPVWRMRRSIPSSGRRVRVQMPLDWDLKMHEMALNGFGISGFYPFLNFRTVDLARSLNPALRWRKRFYRRKAGELLGDRIISHVAKSGTVVDTEDLYQVESDTLLDLLESRLAGDLLSDDQRRALRADPRTYHLILIQLFYMAVFENLFISGRDDAPGEYEGRISHL